MPDTTIKKVEAGTSPKGEMGQKYLVAGKRVSLRLWVLEPGDELKAATSRDYETVGGSGALTAAVRCCAGPLTIGSSDGSIPMRRF
jgi:hypothetical protein